MRQDISGAELTLIQGKEFKSDELFEVENVDGTWVDLSDRLIAAEITDDVDYKTVTVVFTLARDSGDGNAASLAPLMEAVTVCAPGDICPVGAVPKGVGSSNGPVNVAIRSAPEAVSDTLVAIVCVPTLNVTDCAACGPFNTNGAPPAIFAV